MPTLRRAGMEAACGSFCGGAAKVGPLVATDLDTAHGRIGGGGD